MKALKQLSNISCILLIFISGCRESYSPQVYVPVLNDFPLVDSSDIPRNVILFIGDGMGTEHIDAGGITANGSPGSLHFESFPVQHRMRTGNIWGEVTDSAASATAMATGHKVGNGVLSLEIPGNGTVLKTLGEQAREAGKSIGFVTTDNLLSATPAAFAVHSNSRNNYTDIASQMLAFKPDLMFGGGLFLDISSAIEAGYTVIEDSRGLEELDSDLVSPFLVYGRFGDDIMPYETDGRGTLPSLDTMTERALDLLEEGSDGFFLLVENELTDEASHLNDIEKLVAEVDALDKAVVVASNWADARELNLGYSDVLIIVTADHETGGLKVLNNNGQGVVPSVSWTGSNHTSEDVRVYATGKGSDDVGLILENMDIYRLLTRFY